MEVPPPPAAHPSQRRPKVRRTELPLGIGDDSAFFNHINARKETYVSRLSKFVAIPSVSGDPARREDVVRAVHWARDWCQALGGAIRLEDVGEETLEDGSKIPLPPVLLSQFGDDPQKKTVLVYGHLDVQPAKKSDGWDTDPFELVQKNGVLYGRGTTDDKGPATAWLWVVEAYKDMGRQLPVNVRFIFEGMEESGSKGLPDLCYKLGESGEFLDPNSIDFISVSDNYWVGKSKPCLTHGLRGNSYYSLQVIGSTRDLHSGLAGGVVREAMTDLVYMMATLVDTSGKILIEGIYDDVVPVSDEMRERYKSVEVDLDDIKTDFGVSTLLHSNKDDILLHRWDYPTLSLHGIQGAFDGVGSKTVIPGKVIGKFSLRTVRGMEPDKVDDLVKKHIAKHWNKLGSTNEMKITLDKAGEAWYREPDDDNFRAAAAATLRVHKQTPCFTREGGSIPITGVLEQVCDATVVHLPIGASDDGAHSQNEKINVANYVNGINVLACYLDELAKLPVEQDAASRAAAAAASAARKASNAWRRKCKTNLMVFGCDCLECQV